MIVRVLVGVFLSVVGSSLANFAYAAKATNII